MPELVATTVQAIPNAPMHYGVKIIKQSGGRYSSAGSYEYILDIGKPAPNRWTPPGFVFVERSTSAMGVVR